MSSELLRRNSDELRKRFSEDVSSSDHPSTSTHERFNAPSESSSANNKRLNTLYKRFDLESLLWILACAVMMYYTDFWPTILNDVRVKRMYFYASLSLFTVTVMIMIYCMIKMPTLNYSNWLQEGPVIVPTLTIIMLLGSLCLIISVWPIWGFITPVILFIAMMAFISLLVTIG